MRASMENMQVTGLWVFQPALKPEHIFAAMTSSWSFSSKHRAGGEIRQRWGPWKSPCFAVSYESTYISPVLHRLGTRVSMRTAVHWEGGGVGILQVLPQVWGGWVGSLMCRCLIWKVLVWLVVVKGWKNPTGWCLTNTAESPVRNSKCQFCLSLWEHECGMFAKYWLPGQTPQVPSSPLALLLSFWQSISYV